MGRSARLHFPRGKLLVFFFILNSCNIVTRVKCLFIKRILAYKTLPPVLTGDTDVPREPISV